MRYLLLSAFTFFYFLSYAQLDTLPKNEEEEVDTVVVIVSPHVVRKTVTLDHSSKRALSWGVFFSASPSYSISYYSVCKNCQGLFDTVKAATRNTAGFRISGGIFKRWEKIGASVYFSLEQHKQHFSFGDTSSINKFNYNVIGGEFSYKILSRKKFRMDAGLSYEYQMRSTISGSTLDEDRTYTVVPIASVRAYRKALSVGGLAVHNTLMISKKSAVSGSVLYRYELHSNTKTSEPFIEQRHTFYPTLGWVFFIQ